MTLSNTVVSFNRNEFEEGEEGSGEGDKQWAVIPINPEAAARKQQARSQDGDVDELFVNALGIRWLKKLVLRNELTLVRLSHFVFPSIFVELRTAVTVTVFA